MRILKLEDVSVRYITGDFKDIGLKDYVMQRLRGEYHVHEFWANRHISFSLERRQRRGEIHPFEGDFRNYAPHGGEDLPRGDHRGPAGAGQRL